MILQNVKESEDIALSEYVYTETQVREMWKRSKEEQVQIAQAKCLEAIVKTEGELSISFSGGKDSAVVLFLMAEMWSISKQKEKPLKVFFANTTNEFVCAAKYRRDYIEWIQNRFEIEIEYKEVGADSNYFNVVDSVGVPFISKKVSRMIRDCKETLRRLGIRYRDIEKYMPEHYTKNNIEEMIKAADKLRELGFNDTVILNLTKIRSDNHIGLRFLPLQYRPILDNDDIELSEKCCEILKKGPLKKIESEIGKLLAVTGEMAEDSRDRMEAYRKTGCNLFYGKSRKSKPIGPMTEQAVLWLIKKENIPIMPVYGECECKNIDGKEEYELTGEKRTGCKLCGFGIVYDPDRFVRLAKIEPKIIQFAFTSKENGGLGYREICDFLNKNCKMEIGIPQVQEGYYEKRALEYNKRKKEKQIKELIKRKGKKGETANA